MVAKKKSQKHISNKNQNVLVFTGEHSGDLLGGDLISELKNLRPELTYYGVGGVNMEAQGFESLEELEKLAVIGFSEAIKKYSFLKKLLFRIVEEAKQRETKFAILIDYPGFNLRLAKELKGIGIPSVFYVSPQIWAWKFKRIFYIKEHIALMLTLFKFEESIYKEYGVNSKFVGHPITKRIPEKLKKEPALPSGLPEMGEGFVIGLLPGSRKGEISKLIDPILGTAKLLHEHFQGTKKEIVFLLPNINKGLEPFILSKIENLKSQVPTLKIHYLWDSSLRVMSASDLLLIASGTATLEGLFFEKPMVILYKVSLFTYLIGSLLIKSKYIGLANILSGTEVAREITQNEVKPKYILKEALEILENRKYRNKIIKILQETKERELGTLNGARLAAKEISHFYGELIEPNE
ncbi:lipid-A-disaccharide synthase [Leptospira ognonensis]|uniref:Lipid-A-disaccharide synthase n=1 Tax=Leptospira ognonensis TaxID=2484945 RepID=A0A4R9K5Z8_9LEPT|nr:lipid-A-disaccharide synthase [Leptospira ognonensis]TGL59717.1 lipid-A-disaccharide synthase [Leptospira ognonensis]